MKDYFSNLPQQYNSSSNEGENKLPNPQPSNPIPIPTSPGTAAIMGMADVIKETINCFTDYCKCKEHEKTERKRIVATLKAIEYQINAQKEIYLKELDKQYEERNKLYCMAEKVQEKALSTGDKEMLQLCYNFILNVYNKPVKENGYLLDGYLNSSDYF